MDSNKNEKEEKHEIDVLVKKSWFTGSRTGKIENYYNFDINKVTKKT